MALVADGDFLAGRRRGGDVGAGEYLVDVVDQLSKRFGFAVAGLSELDAEIGADMAGIAAEDDDAVGQKDGFFDVVGDEEDGLGGHGFVGPQLEQFTAEVLGGEHVEGAEWLVHEEDFGLDDEGAGKADSLLHAAGEFLGISGLKAVQTHRIEHLHAAIPPFVGWDAAGLEGSLDVFQDGEPGKEREALEDDRDVDLSAGDRLFVPVDLACGGRGEAAQHAEHRRFA